MHPPTHYSDMAARWGQTAEQRAAAAEAKPAEPEPKPDAAQPLQINVPDDVKAFRESESESAEDRHARTTYSETYAPILKEEPAPLAAELSHIGFDLGLSADDFRTIGSIVAAAGREPPTAETRATWQSVRPLEAEQIADANALLARDPRVGTILKNLGLSGHPRILEILAPLAATARARGRLT